MKNVRKGLLCVAILAALPATALAGKPSYQGTFNVEGMRNVSYHPSEFTDWSDITGPQNEGSWDPDLDSKVAEYSIDLGVVWRGDEKDIDVPDFTQSRPYEVEQERFEQQMQLEVSTGTPMKMGDPIRHTRIDDRIEDRVVDAINGTWGAQADSPLPVCKDWIAADGNGDVYVTPWTQKTGQKRECVWPQQRTVVYNTGVKSVTFEQKRELHYWEEQTAQGLLNNRSCKTLKDFYNANYARIHAADKNFRPDGYNRLDLSTSLNYKAYCKDGWTLVVVQREKSPKAWSGQNYSSDLSAKWSQGYTLPQSWLPGHSQWAVGRDTNPLYRFDHGQYTTGNINATLTMSGRAYRVNRSSGGHYRWHNPWSAWASNSYSNYTLTVEDRGSYWHSNYRWAFSPYERASCSRGYALQGARYGSYDNYAWTIWVR
ncbi:hypothetical protein [Vibrio harveyi]|uniref:hypothetical protein n=1 Tax=Vibrio harveyi TaxID=669 RepID=UPI003CEF73F3